METDSDMKMLLGRLLGEVFSLRRALKLEPRVSDATIFGLLNGFEVDVDEMLPEMVITDDMLETVGDVLDRYFDPENLADLEGFYTIERELADRGVSRSAAHRIFRQMRLNGQFTSVIDKIEAARFGGSPTEMLHLRVRDEDL